jgi:cation transport ATPase
VPDPVRVEADLIEPVIEPVLSDDGAPQTSPERRELGLSLVALSLIAGGLSMALELGEMTRLVAMARVVLLAVGTAALMGRALTMRRDPAWPYPVLLFAAPALAAPMAGWALLLGSAEQAARAGFVGATVLTVAALDLWLVGLAARPIQAARRWVAEHLDVPGRRVATAAPERPGAAVGGKELTFEIKPGDQVVVEAGDTVPVDLEIREGEVEVLPWVGAATRVRRKANDVLVAGARVHHGQARGVCTFTGDDRALARPVLATARRADVHAAVPRLARSLAERVAPAVAAAAGGVYALLGWGLFDVAMLVVAVYAALGNVAVGTLAGLTVARGVKTALTRGIVYHTAAAWDGCARVSAAVFCARGTLLSGEPELVEVDVFRRGNHNVDEQDVVALAAGALAAERTPVALAVRRAAAERRRAPEPVRNVRAFSALGVSAVAATGEALCVGTRALLLQRRISVAAAEQRIYELESAGRAVLLVAKAGRLLGLLAFKDGLRAGARAAVQQLLDARVEPVLMSTDTRATCEALGRALDLDHLRPEVLDEERGEAVTRIRDGGAAVAVIGHSPHDDVALEVADAAVVMGAAGRERDAFAVSLVSDDVRDAALAVSLAHRTRVEALTVLLLTAAPAAVGILAATAGVLPAEYAPLAQLLGAIAGVWQLRQGSTSGAG